MRKTVFKSSKESLAGEDMFERVSTISISAVGASGWVARLVAKPLRREATGLFLS